MTQLDDADKEKLKEHLKAITKILYQNTPLDKLKTFKVKAILRKLQARTYQDLIDGITEAMLQVTQQDIRNWFTHCCYCTS
jgi:hypothetical protein